MNIVDVDKITVLASYLKFRQDQLRPLPCWLNFKTLLTRLEEEAMLRNIQELISLLISAAK